MTSHKPKTWKAWAAFDSGGQPIVVRFTWVNAKNAAHDIPCDIRPVVITLAKPRRKKK